MKGYTRCKCGNIMRKSSRICAECERGEFPYPKHLMNFEKNLRMIG